MQFGYAPGHFLAIAQDQFWNHEQVARLSSVMLELKQARL